MAIPITNQATDTTTGQPTWAPCTTSECQVDNKFAISEIPFLYTFGVTIRPIKDIGGHHEFNEVFFNDYFVPDDMMVGGEGDGWSMVTSELAFERSGPDRFLSDFRLLVELVEHIGANPDQRQAMEIGRLVAHLAALLRDPSRNRSICSP